VKQETIMRYGGNGFLLWQQQEPHSIGYPFKRRLNPTSVCADDKDRDAASMVQDYVMHNVELPRTWCVSAGKTETSDAGKRKQQSSGRTLDRAYNTHDV